MPEISYTELMTYLEEIKGQSPGSVYLLHGEEMLYKTALNNLIDNLLSPSGRNLNQDVIDGVDENIFDVIERMNTYSLLSGPKVISLIDSKIFYAKQDTAKLYTKLKDAYDKNELRKAAKSFATLLSIFKLTFEDFKTPEGRQKFALEEMGDTAWLEQLNTYCLEEGVRIPRIESAIDALHRAVEKGFPKGNYLIITTDLVDKRRNLYKSISNSGLIIDCSVPGGDRRDDKMAQDKVLGERVREILSKRGKAMDRETFSAVRALSGFDLRTFSQNIEKLADYVGERRDITVADVDDVLSRTKKDPIYEFTNAVSNRNLSQSLFYLTSLLSDDTHPLQILAAIANQMRKLIMAKGFLMSEHGNAWRPGLSYNQFRNTVMPAIKDYDQDQTETLNNWEALLAPGAESGDKKSPKNAKKVKTDLLISKYARSPYPVFLLLQKAEQFSEKALFEALDCLARTDMQLKSTGQNPKLLMESAIFDICSEDHSPGVKPV